MKKRRWTVVLVPHGSEPSKVIEVSYSALKLLGSAAVVVVLLVFLAGYTTLSRSVGSIARGPAGPSNDPAVSEQLDELQSRIGLLSDTLAELSRRDARIRVLANLEPIDPQVRAAGIGGPATGAPLALAGASGPEADRAGTIRVDLNSLIRRANLLAGSFREAADSLASHTERLKATPSIMPTRGWLSSAFSSRRVHPLLHVSRPHEGIDVSAPMGSPIEAPGAGVVREAGWRNGYGNTVMIDHGYGIRTYFAHASKILVKRGQRVERGQRIALVGNTGLASGPHLHYEVHVNGRPVNPLRYVLPESISMR